MNVYLIREMEKKKVLVYDDRKGFLKMFKRQFKAEFEFSENFLLNKEEDKLEGFDHLIFVIYNKEELVEFLKIDKMQASVLVCLFDKQLFSSLSFLEEIENLILFDSAKTRTEIVAELRSYFKKMPGSKSKVAKSLFSAPGIFQAQFYDFYKALFFLM